ncbi:MAG TPA: universal stress protein [Pseudonocardiaceae bacterium]|nr:universal stress protein [Pseudonocardiaceae bacterium]
MTRVVVWLTEGTWAGCVAAATTLAPADSEFVLLHVTDGDVAEAVHGAFSGLLGRGHADPATLDDDAGRRLLARAAEHLGRPATTETRTGAVGHEVVGACSGADLLVCARDGARDRLGPRSLGKQTRFVVDHAPCAVLLVWPDDTPGLASIPPAPPRR